MANGLEDRGRRAERAGTGRKARQGGFPSAGAFALTQDRPERPLGSTVFPSAGGDPAKVRDQILDVLIREQFPGRLRGFLTALPRFQALAGGSPRALAFQQGPDIRKLREQLFSGRAELSRSLGPFGGGLLESGEEDLETDAASGLARLFASGISRGRNQLAELGERSILTPPGPGLEEINESGFLEGGPETIVNTASLLDRILARQPRGGGGGFLPSAGGGGLIPSRQAGLPFQTPIGGRPQTSFSSGVGLSNTFGAPQSGFRVRGRF